jgi:hypothetical protein
MNLKSLSPFQILRSIDDMLRKIPDDIAALLKKIGISLFVFFISVAAYYGWTLGYSDNHSEGLKLAEDTKTMFLQDIEREYNRKRKNIRLRDVELDISRRVDDAMLREEIESGRLQGDSLRVVDPESRSVSEGMDLGSQRQNSVLPPALAPREDRSEWIPGRDDSGEKYLERRDKISDPISATTGSAESDWKTRNLEENMDSIQKKTEQLEKALDKLEKLEKRELIRPSKP